MSERDELVEAITRRILAELQQSAGKDGCCADCSGSCAACCSDKVRQTVEAGASRISYQGDGGKIPADLARYIDHTLLKPDATAADIDRYCAEAKKFGFAAVCVNPVWVKRAAESLRGSNVVVASVVGFPLGAQTTDIKVLEARRALRDGAKEIDMVMNVGALKSGDQPAVKQDIARVAEACHEARAVLKVILETGLLTDEEKVIASKLARAARADFVKTSTGFGPGGATPFDVALMREAVGPAMGVKASGGVRTREQAEAMIAAGATRIGASAGIAIVGGESEKGGTASGRY